MDYFANLRLRAAVAVGKAALAASKLAGREGTILPGSIIERVCPSVLYQLGKPSTSVFVTGTNGKTTTTNMLDDILEMSGQVFVDNRAGGNITEGIIAALVKDAHLDGTSRKDLAVLEVDEQHTRLVFKDMTPSVVLVTNLYRDSFVRNANPEYILQILDRAIPKETHVILNADDLISLRLGNGRKRVTYYSIDRLASATMPMRWITNDVPDCPYCAGVLSYDYCHLRHVGKAHCLNCGFTNPAPDYEVTYVDAEPGGHGSFVMRENSTPGSPEYTYDIASYSTATLYDLVGAIVAARELGISAKQIAAALRSGVSVPPSRYRSEVVNGVELLDVLAKGWNPSACSSVMTSIREAPGAKALVLSIDDYRAENNVAASDFMGWTYTADLEQLADESVRQIVVAGSRAKDFELRLLLAGVPHERITIADNHYAMGDAVILDGIDRVYWAYDWESDEVVRSTHARVAERLTNGGAQ